MTAHRTDRLIDQLTEDLTPVRRLPSPVVQATLWLALAGGFLAGIVAWHGLRGDWWAVGGRLDFRMELAATILTGIGAALAAFTSAIPGRSRLWRYAALPPLLLWLSLVGQGCLVEWLRGDGVGRVISLHCMQQISWTGIAAGAPMLWALRRARPLFSRTVAFNAGLATSALAAAAMSLYHSYDSSLLILVSHLGTVAAVTCLIGSLHRPILAPAPLMVATA